GDASVAIDAGSSVADSGTPVMTPDAGHAAGAGHARATGSGGSASPPVSMMPAPAMTASGSGGQASPPAASALSMTPVVPMAEPGSESQSGGSSGCSTAPPGSHAGLHWLLLAAALPIVRALLRRRPKSQGDVDG